MFFDEHKNPSETDWIFCIKRILLCHSVSNQCYLHTSEFASGIACKITRLQECPQEGL